MNQINYNELSQAETSNSRDASPPDEKHIELISLDLVESQEARWLIDGTIPEGDITMLVGDGGVGKGFIWSNIVAAISSGSESIFDKAYLTEVDREPRKVIVFSSEDSLSVQVKKRLQAAGANLKNVLSIDLSDPMFQQLQFNSDFVAEIIEQEHPALMVFDPIQSFIGRINIAARNEVRNALNPLISLGAEYNTSFLIVVHTNKKMDAAGRNRMADSADLWDIARSVLITGFTDERGVRYLSHEKCNYGPLMDTILYTIEQDRIEYESLTDNKDYDFVKAQREQKHRKAERLDYAMTKILDILSQGSKPVKEVDAICLADGISEGTLKRAKRALNDNHDVIEWSRGVAEKHTWYMQAVKHSINDSE